MPSTFPAEQAPPPVAKIADGADPYAWLRDRADPNTLAYLEAENAYTADRMKHTVDLQAKLYSELLGRILQTDKTVPAKRGEYFYYTRTEEGKQYAIYCRTRGEQGAEEILLDGNAISRAMKRTRFE